MTARISSLFWHKVAVIGWLTFCILLAVLCRSVFADENPVKLNPGILDAENGRFFYISSTEVWGAPMRLMEWSLETKTERVVFEFELYTYPYMEIELAGWLGPDKLLASPVARWHDVPGVLALERGLLIIDVGKSDVHGRQWKMPEPEPPQGRWRIVGDYAILQSGACYFYRKENLRYDGTYDLWFYPANSFGPEPAIFTAWPIVQDDQIRLILSLSPLLGFQVFDTERTLLWQQGSAVDRWFTYSSFDPWPTEEFHEWVEALRESYPISPRPFGRLVFFEVREPILDPIGLVLFYDPVIEGVFVCCPTGNLLKFIPTANDVRGKYLVGTDLTNDDGYMLLFEDGSYFVADYSDIAEQVRSGKLDPLGPLRELMGLEEE